MVRDVENLYPIQFESEKNV